MKRIAFLIIGTNQNPWRRIYLRGQLPTWISQLDENETHLVIYSDSSMGTSHPNKHNGLKIDFTNGLENLLLILTNQQKLKNLLFKITFLNLKMTLKNVF